MADREDYSHLKDIGKALIHATDQERIHAIRAGTWINYPSAKEILAWMEDLLDYPRITRMPNMLLVAPSFNGKTSLLEHFMKKHPPDLDPVLEVTNCPVVMVEAPETPNVSALYSRILDKLMAPYKPGASPQEKDSQIKYLFSRMGVKMLIIDEINNLIAGSSNKQRAFRNALKGLGNATKIVIVAAGTEDAYNAFNQDPQMSSRFTPKELPLWKAGKLLAQLFQTLEERTPLKRPSNLKDPAKMQEIHFRSEGALGDICDLFKELAVDAIRNKSEQITLESIQTLRWVPPSKRKQYRRL